MYKIKQIPEDFNVKEILTDGSISQNGKFYVYSMLKRDLTTFQALDIISNRFKIKRKDIGYSGLKDKKAITLQYISIPKKRKFNEEYDFDDVSLRLVGFRDERLFPGFLQENRFLIVVRNVTNKPKIISRMLNFFGEQRFSSENIEIGRRIIKGKYAEAVDLISKVSEDHFFFEYINANSTDTLGALNRLNKNILRIYLQAYQSYLWNICVEKYISSIKQNSSSTPISNVFEFPLVGFDVDNCNDAIYQIINNVLNDEGISRRDFILSKIPGMGLEGGFRKIYVDVKEPVIVGFDDDELNPGMKKCKLSFILPKGSYATEYIKQLFGNI
ncbi:MAG: tRNA pseudouridine(13) synthase TruD [Candidatus Woesearchaeota archaeon]